MTHSFLSPSSARRWINCPPSARMCEGFPEESTQYAEEGTAAHALGEAKLLEHFGLAKPGECARLADEARSNEFYLQDPAEMESCTDFYLETVKGLQGESPLVMQVESEIDLNDFIPDGHGTADCFFIEGRTLNVVDYKHGKGVAVDAKYNPQLMLYALGIYAKYNFLFEIRDVIMTICQPRLNNVSSFRASSADLLKFGEEAKGAAKLAWEGCGERKAGEWCRFCRAKAVCSEQAERALRIRNRINGDVNCLTLEELKGILDEADGIIDYLNSAKDYALKTIMDGSPIPGWKCVEGRSRRAFRDEGKAMEIAARLLPESELYERRPVSLAVIEKKLGKKAFRESLGELVFSPPGSPTLARAEDKRPEYTPDSPEEDFKNL